MITFKVVTACMRSLGLRGNPTILTFRMGHWTSSPKKQTDHRDDGGGIWSARTLSGARTLVSYMRWNYGIQCRIFMAKTSRVLHSSSYRVQSSRLKLIEEIL
jgi:predicted RNA-binding protein